MAILWETYTLILIGWLYSNLPPDWSILLQFLAVFYLSIVAILWETYTLILIGWLYSNLPPDWSILLQFVAVFYLSIVAILVGNLELHSDWLALFKTAS